MAKLIKVPNHSNDKVDGTDMDKEIADFHFEIQSIHQELQIILARWNRLDAKYQKLGIYNRMK